MSIAIGGLLALVVVYGFDAPAGWALLILAAGIAFDEPRARD